MLIGAYESENRISVSVAALKPIGFTVYCRYFDKNGTEHEKPMKAFIYPLFVVICDKKSAETHRVAITDGSIGDVPEQFQVVVTRWNENYKRFLTHCSAPIFGKEPKWLHLVEMIEHYKLQGVSKFYFYVREIELNDMFLLKHYAIKREEVELIDIPSIYFDAVSQQLLAIADCHLRNRLSANWTIFSDIDERLVMTEEKETIREFLQESISEKYGAVMFAQRWIFKYEKLPEKFINYQQIMEEMPTRKWSLTTQPAVNCTDGKHCWGKMIINNQKVLQMLVHDVGEYENGYVPFILDPEVGYIRHYRDMNLGKWWERNRGAIEKYQPFTNTTYSPYFGSQLLSNVLQVLHEIYKPQR
ncbi:hypothetical protein GCK72_016481 [Caenorhabditis remanei]|uniref:Glycosyltransferase family 92 protein n=1 Tax=Caenorhabditis remanei TaxID=31234 RepID=A0A6A5G4T6_CAERE|nr:hypothetical protein GCK72_016481 [Caenorhabditis remanei]KAF1749936.1 hypothetical protein GCK72_016481 [Caenorhabditis remanei]